MAMAPALAAQDTLATSTKALSRGDSSALRLGALYELVATRNPELDAARALARAVEARIPGARRPPDPQIQLGFMNRSLPSLAPMDPLGMTQIQLMQMVPVAGKLSLAGRVASSQAAAAHERAEEVRWDQRSRVAMAFYELYQADRSLAVAINTRRLLEDIAKTTASMYAVGDGRQADVLKARVEVARMTEDVVRMGTMRIVATATLNALVNTTVDSALASPELPAFPESLPPLDSLQRLAELNRPMIRAGLADVRAADASARLAAREIWPDLQVGVQYGQRGGAMGTERMGSLMIGASLPVFAGSRQLRMREEAQAMKAMAVADLLGMRAQTRARVSELYASILRARKLAALYRGNVLPQSRAGVTSALSAYRVGQVNLMALLDGQMTVNRYEQELSALDAEQGKALAELEMLIGRALFDANAASARSTGSTP
jgi:outer membrane protein TolC